MELLPSNFFSRLQLNGLCFTRQTNAFLNNFVFVYEGLLDLFLCLKILIEGISAIINKPFVRLRTENFFCGFLI